MKRFLAPILLLLTAAFASLPSCSSTPSADSPGEWQTSFPVDKSKLTNTGSARYFILEPGYRLHYAHDNASLIVTVLNETRLVDGVQTRIIEERESENGQLTEISRNYFALDPSTGNVYYFGEDVDMYANGSVTGHGGSWLSGVNGAHFGLMMPGNPTVGQKFHHEVAPTIALDRAQVLRTDAILTTPAGTFHSCAEIRETTPLEKGTGLKTYAPNVGLIQDDQFLLVKIEKPR